MIKEVFLIQVYRSRGSDAYDFMGNVSIDTGFPAKSDIENAVIAKGGNYAKIDKRYVLDDQQTVEDPQQ